MTITTIAGGGAHDFLTVRHVRAHGSQREIGSQLAAAAHAVHGRIATPGAGADGLVESTRRRWFEHNYPEHAARMLGVADHFGLDHRDPSVSLDWLWTFDRPAGCSVAFYPGGGTADGHGVLSRNFDFPTATFTQLTGRPPLPDERPLAADPWVVELHPDDGYASITIGIMDVMGAMDGINEAGLAVALLADNETPDPEPSGGPRVGLAEHQVVRYLLDTCATVAEAKRALLMAKHYYFFTPCHFVVADRTGDSFVWEHSPRRNQEVIVESASDGRIVCTNHLLHRWPDPAQMPADDGPIGTAALTYRRWRELTNQLHDRTLVDREDIREQFAGVSFTAPIVEARTFWHAMYDVNAATLDVSFFTHDEDGTSRYTPPIKLGMSKHPARVRDAA